LVHAAHGWIFNQFLSPIINKRTDAYGGSLENRMRFPLMVLKRIRDHVGPDRVVLLRLSGSERDPNGYTTDDVITFLLCSGNVDFAEIISRV
jgi:2,4-dienoyl-CoA reductase-like NADH-dependent reductase (Old Yellow Enzyme family)